MILSIGKEELDRTPLISEGDSIVCPHCGMEHAISQSRSLDGGSGSLQFYKCGEKAYLAGVDGKSVMEQGGKDV